jgi:ABC-2 type transport system ATP-binding protein
MNNEIIRVSNVSRIFKIKPRRNVFQIQKNKSKERVKNIVAVDDVSFSVMAGERLALIGPNGAGKSTTLKMLIGILYPSAGNVTVMEYIPWKRRQSLAKHIGVLFGQKSQLWYHLTPIDNFELFCQIYRINPHNSQNRIEYLINKFGVSDYLRTPVRKLSLGQRMRCELVATLLHSPKILILDEPTIGLDVLVKLQLRDTIIEISEKENTTILLASHDANDIEMICTRVLVMDKGRLHFDGSLEDLKSSIVQTRQVVVKVNQPIEFAPVITGVKVLQKNLYDLTLEIDLTVTQIDKVINEILSSHSVIDLLINMPSMENIIRQIYINTKGE